MRVTPKAPAPPRPATESSTSTPPKALDGHAPGGQLEVLRPPVTVLDGTSRVPKRIGPEQAGKPGDVVQAPALNITPSEVLAAQKKLDALVASDPGALARIRAQPFPRSEAKRLEWALAQPSGLPNLQNPLWTTATNDARAAVVAFARGVIAAQAQGLPVTDTLETQALAARTAVLSKPDFATLQTQAFPENAPLGTQLEWAAAMTYAWDWTNAPNVKGNAKAEALVTFMNGVLAKEANNLPPVRLETERRTMTIDGDTRVFAIATPPGTPPKGGWPTVLFFHGSYGGHAPEQQHSYQQLNAIAAARGVQVVYPVGLPQDRADAQTGRGMLNWDPVGAGPGGANDKFVHALIDKLVDSKGGDRADRSRIYAAGHSQGGFYTSDLVAAYPGVFAGAAVLGAGLGSVALEADFASQQRKTPTLLRVGLDDIHLGVGEQLAARFDGGGFGTAFQFDRLPNRGHEVLEEDLGAMLDFFAKQPAFTASKAGTLDGTKGEAGVRPKVFRDLDLSAPPPGLQQNATLWRAVLALAQNPTLQLDGDARTLTADEWRLALSWAPSFPPAMQQAIANLRPFFVVAPPPGGKHLDLAALPPEIRANRSAMAALQTLTTSPMLDLDGYPGLFTAEEAATAGQFVSQLPPELHEGVELIRTWFFGTLSTPTVDDRQRAVKTLPGGGKLETYPGSEAAAAKLEALVASLSADPKFARVLAKTTLVITPPGKGLESVPETQALGAEIEGVATSFGFEGGGRTIPPPAFVIRQDSILGWNLGAAHELLHLLRFDQGDQALKDTLATWNAIGGKDGQPDGYPNAEEMFAYFGQWYLAGFGAELKAVSPDAFALCEKYLGQARIDPGTLTAATARTSLESLLGWFQSGRHQPV